MSQPLVSAVVPVYDGRPYLAEALASALAQTWARSPARSRRALEVVVVDDGSTDGSPEVAASFAEARAGSSSPVQVRVVRRPHRGVAAARNAGVAAARGRLLAFLDQDDRWTPDKLERQVAHLEAHPEDGFCLARQRLFLEPGVERPGWLKPELLEKDQPGYVPGTLVVRREVFDAVGPFDEGRPVASDADWFLRAKDAGVGMAMLPDVLLERRIHRANQSAQTLQGTSELLHAVRASILRQRRRAAEEGAG